VRRKAQEIEIRDEKKHIMENNREELKKKTLAAASAEEIMEIMKAAGEEITAEEAAQLFEKAQAKKDGQGTLPGRAGGRFRRRGPQLGNRRLCGNRGIRQLVRQQ
jgi:hypothetical protein